jgi:hypothetical protein
VAELSLYDQAKELARQLNSILSALDVDSFSHEERNIVVAIKQLLEHVRLGARDYDFADTKYEQEQNAVETKQYLEQLQSLVLKGSEFNFFGAVDVAHASARIQQIISKLR